MREWDKTPELAKLMKSLAGGTAEGGLQTIEQILRLQGILPSDELQEAYVLLLLIGRSPREQDMEEIERRLRSTPAYSESRVDEHAQLLTRAASSARGVAEGRAAASAIPRLKGYGSSLALQQAHAEALFEVSNLPQASPLELADQIAAIPSFRDAPEIQFAYARACCNATARDNARVADQAVSRLATLPGRAEHHELEECYQRAVRNRDRLNELRKTSTSKQAHHAGKAAAAVLLGLALAGGTIAALRSGDDKNVQPAAAPTVVALSQPEADLKRYLQQATQALRKGDNDQAITVGLKARQLADTLHDSKSQSLAYDVIGTAYLATGDKGRAKAQWENILQADLPPVIEIHLQTADEALTAKDKKALSREFGSLSILLELLTNQPDHQLLERLAVVYEKGGAAGAAALARQRMGDFEKGARLAEAAGDWDLALQMWQALAKKDPAQKGQLSAFRSRAGERAVKGAESGLAANDPKSASQNAESALKLLEGVPRSGESRARALTVLAKLAYKEEAYGEAVALAKDAYTAAPNGDRRTRLDSYRYKDAEIVTRDELDVDTFVFPPAKKSSQYYTYCYWMGPEADYITGATEELFQAPKDEISGGMSYSSQEQGVSIRLTTYDARSYNFSFDAGRDKKLRPGVYDDATRFPFNMLNPGFDFSGNGRGCNQSNSRFVVHEISWTGDGQLASFAADFISACDSRTRGSFGKVRYNSHYQ